MSRAIAGLAVAALGALAALAALGAVARADIGTVSPGKLAAAHAALETQCNRCHVPFGGIPQRQCLACHTQLADRIARGLGLHPTVKAQPCTDCHKEHHGRDAITRSSRAIAAIPAAAHRGAGSASRPRARAATPTARIAGRSAATAHAATAPAAGRPRCSPRKITARRSPAATRG
ncbi:MAG: hypothetical protein E6J90_01300 [Deltaproteobacteria bacterium]|nr:MAG: hypothetical protein E6J90_01300 [Deltaproteobacteria bacterium]